MKKFVFCMLSLAMVKGAHAETYTIKSEKAPIDQVRLYDRGARVERLVNCELGQGRHILEIRGLTGALSRNTLQLIGLPHSVRVLEVTPRTRIVKDNPSEKVKKLQDEIRDFHYQIEDKSDLVSLIARERQRLNLYQDIARRSFSEQTVRVSYEGNLKETMAFFTQRRQKLNGQYRTLEQEIKDLREKINLASRNLSELRPQSHRLTDVSIIVEAEKAFRGQGKLTYVVESASWTPIYEAHNSKDTLSFAIGARVNQSSGEDWSDVQLTFSTARPSLGASAPSLQHVPLRFHKVDPDRQINLGLAESKAMKVAGGDLANLSRTPPADGTQRIIKTGINVVLKAEGRSNVSSGAGWSRVAVMDHQFKSSKEWITIPSINQRVFRRVTAKNTAGHALLAGDVQIFNDGRFLGYSSLRHRSNGEALNLSLGEDSLLKVRRYKNKHRTKSFKEGTFTSSKEGTVSWIIEIKNEGDTVRSVIVKESIPVPEIEGISVKLTDECSKPDDQAKDGILTWVEELGPGQVKQIRVEYTIKIPGNMKMSLPSN